MSQTQKVIIVLLAVFTIASAQTDCKDTHLEYFSEYALGRQDQFNKTFIRVQEKIPTLNNVSFKANQSVTYTIGGIKPQFYYIDTKQRADIVGHDTVVIQGGYVQVTFDFQWARSGVFSASGNGSAIGRSDILAIAYQLRIKDGYMTQFLIDCEPVKFNDYGFNISRINPPDATEEDLKNLKKLLNDILNVTTVKHELQDEIQKYYRYFMSASLYDDRRIIDQVYTYDWVSSSKGRVNITYSINATGVDIQPDGIRLTYLAGIKDYPTWKCEFLPPPLPLNPAVYGGTQQFITFDVYKNTLKYAIDNGVLDVELSRSGWESKFFQFYAGDLYEVIPKVATRFLASQTVSGSCRSSSRYMNFSKGGYDFFNVTLGYNCQLGVNRDKVTQFQLNITLAVQGRANETNLNFHVINQTHTVVLIPYMDYQIQNPVLAQHMISHSLNRLHDARVFGSGWKLYQRDYPHFMVEDHYTVVYDSTHVDPHLSQQ